MDTKEYKAIIDRIIAVVPYVTTTLRMADDHIVDKGRGTGEKWGEVHLGRAGSSISQLESLLSDARRLKEEEHE